MPTSYQKIQQQIQSLQRQAEKLKAEEVAGVVGRIKVAIAHYGLTAEQLGLAGTSASNAGRARVKSQPSSKTAKYSDGQGNEWGGRGPRPHWLRDALASGKTLQEFLVGASAPAKTPSAATKPATKRKARLQYGDAAGNRWSGMGPRPRWLREAIEAGASLDQFVI